jgi:hypothetical protein
VEAHAARLMQAHDVRPALALELAEGERLGRQA